MAGRGHCAGGLAPLRVRLCVLASARRRSRIHGLVLPRVSVAWRSTATACAVWWPAVEKRGSPLSPFRNRTVAPPGSPFPPLGDGPAAALLSQTVDARDTRAGVPVPVCSR